jgi:HSP20 family protein
MSISDLIPRKNNEANLGISRHRTENRLLDLRGQLDRLFDEFFDRSLDISPFAGDFSELGDFSPRMDLSETEKEITLSAELPGIDPEEINISLDGNTLSIRGEKHSEKEDKDKHYYRLERSYGSFQRSIPLPAEVDEAKIEATLKKGLLEVKMPKTQEAQQKKKRIPIKIS